MKDQLEALINQMVEQGIAYEDAVSEFEKRFIKRVLEKSNGNQSKAAGELRIHRNTLSRKIDEFNLDHRSRSLRRTRLETKPGQPPLRRRRPG
ncbi:MAG TPA: helix-turn-helix domain-containing protein [Terriglobia bacterium]|nr:helix-turn-helix domain-containing protein [Terriglobia bacterium]